TRCYRDWSSDVCSSDLPVRDAPCAFRGENRTHLDQGGDGPIGPVEVEQGGTQPAEQVVPVCGGGCRRRRPVGGVERRGFRVGCRSEGRRGGQGGRDGWR